MYKHNSIIIEYDSIVVLDYIIFYFLSLFCEKALREARFNDFNRNMYESDPSLSWSK